MEFLLVLLKLGAPNLNTSPKPRLFWGYLPDVTVRVDATSPGNTQGFGYLKSTLYHELAHVSHYFKVGNSFWIENIAHILATTPGIGNGPIYGGNPATDSHASFLCLTEGWAEYIGQLYASMRYPNFSAIDFYPTLSGSIQSPYSIHLEENDYFFNIFIPKGLFYDLTDEEPGGDLNEITWDKVDYYTTAQMYGCLTANTKSIPEFRSKLLNLWGGNSNHVNDLFLNYKF